MELRENFKMGIIYKKIKDLKYASLIGMLLNMKVKQIKELIQKFIIFAKMLINQLKKVKQLGNI